MYFSDPPKLSGYGPGLRNNPPRGSQVPLFFPVPGSKIHQRYGRWDPKSQMLVPKSIEGVVFGTRAVKYWVLGLPGTFLTIVCTVSPRSRALSVPGPRAVNGAPHALQGGKSEVLGGQGYLLFTEQLYLSTRYRFLKEGCPNYICLVSGLSK